MGSNSSVQFELQMKCQTRNNICSFKRGNYSKLAGVGRDGASIPLEVVHMHQHCWCI